MLEKGRNQPFIEPRTKIIKQHKNLWIKFYVIMKSWNFCTTKFGPIQYPTHKRTICNGPKLLRLAVQIGSTLSHWVILCYSHILTLGCNYNLSTIPGSITVKILDLDHPHYYNDLAKTLGCAHSNYQCNIIPTKYPWCKKSCGQEFKKGHVEKDVKSKLAAKASCCWWN